MMRIVHYFNLAVCSMKQFNVYSMDVSITGPTVSVDIVNYVLQLVPTTSSKPDSRSLRSSDLESQVTRLVIDSGDRGS
jgi:hypothetical protein